MSEGRIRVMSGADVPSREELHAFISSVLGDREIATRVEVVDNTPVPHVPTEIELWNAAVDARKAAKRYPSAYGREGMKWMRSN